jgi:hypothetical protein
MMRWFSVLVSTLLIIGCDSSSNSRPTAFNTISGTASKGIIAGGTVSLLDSDGNAVGSVATTGTDGTYSIELTPQEVAAGISTPLQVIVSSDGSATSVCDADLDAAGDNDCFAGFDASGNAQFAAFGSTFTLPADFTMRAVLPDLPTPTNDGASATVNPTPLTEVATALALGTGTTLTTDQANSGNSQALAILGVITGVDVSGVSLNEIPVVNVTDAASLTAATELSVAAASVSAGVISTIDQTNADRDSISEAVTALGAEVSARVQATGNSNAVPSTTLSALSSGTSQVINRLSAQNQALSALQGIASRVTNVAEQLAQVPADVDAVVTPGSSDIDLGDFAPSGLDQSNTATVNSGLVGEYNLEYGDFSADSDRDPFSDGEQVTAVVGSDNSLTLGTNTYTSPFFLSLGGSVQTNEVVWLDSTANIVYALSSNDSGTFNEINVGDAANLQASGGPGFLGQLSQVSADSGGGSGGSAQPSGTCGDNNGGAITGLALISNCAGNYTVTSSATGTHNRGTITIATDGAVDFDTDINFPASPAPTVFDRLSIEGAARIQANYGTDDDGPVIQLFFSQDGTLTQISYRNRTESVEIVANVAPS